MRLIILSFITFQWNVELFRPRRFPSASCAPFLLAAIPLYTRPHWRHCSRYVFRFMRNPSNDLAANIEAQSVYSNSIRELGVVQCSQYEAGNPPLENSSKICTSTKLCARFAEIPIRYSSYETLRDRRFVGCARYRHTLSLSTVHDTHTITSLPYLFASELNTLFFLFSSFRFGCRVCLCASHLFRNFWSPHRHTTRNISDRVAMNTFRNVSHRWLWISYIGVYRAPQLWLYYVPYVCRFQVYVDGVRISEHNLFVLFAVWTGEHELFGGVYFQDVAEFIEMKCFHIEW